MYWVYNLVFQKYRQYMAGLLAPPYGVMETGSNNDSKWKMWTFVSKNMSCGVCFHVTKICPTPAWQIKFPDSFVDNQTCQPTWVILQNVLIVLFYGFSRCSTAGTLAYLEYLLRISSLYRKVQCCCCAFLKWDSRTVCPGHLCIPESPTLLLLLMLLIEEKQCESLFLNHSPSKLQAFFKSPVSVWS